MARTKRNAMNIEEARQKIRTTQLVNRLTNHVLGKVKMAPTQVSAALGLLRKTLPDMQATELSGEVKHAAISDKPMAEDDWAEKYGSGVAASGGASKSTH